MNDGTSAEASGAATTLKRWSFPIPGDDAIVTEIEGDLVAEPSLLALFASYRRDLRGNADNQAPALVKLAKLFGLGNTPKELAGHHAGVMLAPRMSGKRHGRAQVDNLIGLVWGWLGEQSPWVGKRFERLDRARLASLTGQPWEPARAAFLGKNLFRPVAGHTTSLLAYHALSLWFGLEDAPAPERAGHPYEREGAPLVAQACRSVWPGSPRELLALNYRWAGLHNRPPLSWLVDELVEIADGLYLGQILLARRRLLASYHPERPVGDWDYDQMGYFLLWSERWNGEARRLFPFLGLDRAPSPTS